MLRCSILVARQKLVVDRCRALESGEMTLVKFQSLDRCVMQVPEEYALHSIQHFRRGAFRWSRRLDRNNCWWVYRAVRADNHSDMLKEPSRSLVMLAGRECELLLASAEELVLEDDRDY
jgi:hypothetical protein